MSILAALVVGALGSGRSTTHRAQCDANLKTISLALGTYLEEHGHLPASLSVLRSEHYLPQNTALRCPDDPTTGGYDDYYVIRAPRDAGDLPIVVCPFHEQHGDHGTQAYKGRFTKQFMTRPATLQSVNNATVESPGKPPVVAYAGMTVNGGDVIHTGPQGMATIRFADNSSAELQGGSQIQVLQSYVDGQTGAPLYTLLRQQFGNVLHTVTTGSRYDVVTPVATAGAHGTQFRIIVPDVSGGASNGTLTVTKGVVTVATLERGYTYTPDMDVYPVLLDPDDTETAEPEPTPTPTPQPTATPTPKPTPTRAHDNRDGEWH
jgi:type II secretory pathway pseudopilin PulG